MAFRLVILLWCAVAFVISYHIYGNVVDTEVFGTSVLGWMVLRWSEAALGGAYYYWVTAVPAVTGWLIWRKRDLLRACTSGSSWVGVAAVGACLFVHWLGVRVQHPRLSLLSVVGLGFAIPWALMGRGVLKHLLLPVGLLIFCIPLNFLDVFNLRLRVFVGNVVSGLVGAFGQAVERKGSRILVGDLNSFGERFQIETSDAASSLAVVLLLVCVALILGELSRRSLLRRAVLVALSVPLVVGFNMFRLLLVVFVGLAFGEDAGHGLQRVASFWLVVIPGGLVLWWVNRLWDQNSGGGWKKWKEQMTTRQKSTEANRPRRRSSQGPSSQSW